MAFKKFALDERTIITVYKRRSSRSLRLSLGADGTARVSIPIWAAYGTGVEFARSRISWIRQHTRQTLQLQHGQPVGKAHHLSFVAAANVTKPLTRVQASQIVVTYPAELSQGHEQVQQAAQAASIRALRQQAEKLLPQRLAALAGLHGFSYKSVGIKRLKSRWGSCDQQGNIVLNLYLMQLPWELIDYVLLHELTHTKVLRHGPDFWRSLTSVLPSAQVLRRQIRRQQPVLRGYAPTSMA